MLNMQAVSEAECGRTVSQWLDSHIAGLELATLPEAPLIHARDAAKILPDLDVWDVWPLQLSDGSVAKVAGGTIWMILSAPCHSDPGARHDVARTRMLYKVGEDWRDCGNLFPERLNPGTREWSGAAHYDPQSSTVTAYFTAAGRQGDPSRQFEQRLFQTQGYLDIKDGAPKAQNWSDPVESVTNDGSLYVDLSVDQGRPGHIRGFRDPYWFCDPATGLRYLIFAGSLADAKSDYNGVVGIAIADAGNTFTLLPPLISGDGVVNEMERPHLVIHAGAYYLFWSSQSHVFAPGTPPAPTGLYGMVAPNLMGPYAPLNGTGLVITNPASEPRQAYCWQVLDTLEVISFVDHWGLEGRSTADDPALNRAQFGGTIAPMLKIAIDGHKTRLIGLA